ncbi:hypothetical protein MWU61_16300 [Loktanella sp. F6476L]|uniref:hypothetical protein n=1 Tax=Loktanella sp. F6476L TaxID=2926405 RepID=UPI001FF5A061|nr:hypothetical protein [Loktanella sp. F6476L]MCK0122115.1 hypothetical protein [Loktanella sp. F6476L]
MPKVILHIGTMKTGTTSIQETLSNNADVMSRFNYTYVGPPMRTSAVLGPTIKALTDTKHDLIISDEGLWHFADSKRSDTHKLAGLLRGYDVTVLIYLRRPDSFLNSWFQQGLKSGTGAKTMSQFLDSPFVKSGLEFSKRIKRFETLFGAGSIKLRAYEKSQLKGGDAVLDFLHVTNLPAEDFMLPQPKNKTPDTDSLLLRSLYQRDLGRSSKLLANLGKLNQHLSNNGYKGRRYNLLTKAELQTIITTYQPEFSRLQSEYGGGVSPSFFESWPDIENANNSLLDLRMVQEEMLSLES